MSLTYESSKKKFNVKRVRETFLFRNCRTLYGTLSLTTRRTPHELTFETHATRITLSTCWNYLAFVCRAFALFVNIFKTVKFNFHHQHALQRASALHLTQNRVSTPVRGTQRANLWWKLRGEELFQFRNRNHKWRRYILLLRAFK